MSASASTASSNFKIIKFIGGTEDKVELIEFDSHVLILKLANPNNIGLFNFNELDIPSRVIHPGIVRVYSMLPRTGSDLTTGFGMTMLAYDNDLNKYMPLANLDWDERLLLTYKLMYILNLMHVDGICHLDIKPQNIFVMGSEPAFGDYGYARVLNKQSHISSHTLMTTISFGPPELIDPSKTLFKYSPAVDVWSLALTILWILTGNVIFPNFSYWNVREPTFRFISEKFRSASDRRRIFRARFAERHPHPTATQASDFAHLVDILTGCTHPNPKARMTLAKAITSPLFQRFNPDIPPLIYIEPVRQYDLPVNFKYDIVRLVNLFVNSKMRIGTVYLAADILYRSIYMLNKTPETYHYIVRRFIGAAAVWIAINTYNFYTGDAYTALLSLVMKHYGIGDRNGDIFYLKTVVDAIIAHALAGVINPKFLFDVLEANQYGPYITSHILEPTVYINIDIVQLRQNQVKTAKPTNPYAREIIKNNFTC